MAWRECVICGCGFEAKGRQVACSKSCSDELRKATIRRWKKDNPEKVKEMKDSWRKRHAEEIRVKKREYHRKTYKQVNPHEQKCTICSSIFLAVGNKKYCSEDCFKRARANKSREYRKENPDYWTEYYKGKKYQIDQQKTQYRLRNPEPKVRNMLKRQLGFTPPEDLVYAATQLRLLNRALRND